MVWRTILIIGTTELTLSCQTCQTHAAAYLEQTPAPILRGLYGVALQQAARSWLFYFHNYVRAMNQQPVMISSVDDCAVMYSICTVSRRDYIAFMQTAAAAIRLRTGESGTVIRNAFGFYQVIWSFKQATRPPNPPHRHRDPQAEIARQIRAPH